MNIKRFLMIAGLLSILVACGDKDATAEEEDLDNVNESGMPIVNDPIELDIFARKAAVSNDNWNDVLTFNTYEEMTNIDIDWEMVPDATISEKLNLTLASGDLPDAFHSAFLSDSDMMKYGEQGVFIPLNDLIEDYAPNFKKVLEENPELESEITFPDGNIYAFPKITDKDFLSYRMKELPWINEEWLDALGLDMPETTEEFYEYLKAVKEGDPNGNGEADEVPYGGREIDPLLSYLMGSFGIANRGRNNVNIDMDPETDELRFYPTTNEYKSLLEYMHKLFDEELIEQNIFSIEDEQYRANAADGKYGSTVFFAPEASIGGDKVKELTGMPSLEGPEGHKEFVTLTPQVDNKSAFIISSENEHPVATVKWIDHFYGEEGMKLFFMGVEGETYEENEDGEPEYMDHILNSEEGKTMSQEQAKYLTFPGGGFPSITTEKYFQGTAETAPSAIEAAGKLEPDMVEDPWPPFIYKKEENDELNSYGADIEKYVSEMRDKFISGDASFDEWDKYVDTLESMKLDEYMEIKQDALDRFEEQ